MLDDLGWTAKGLLLILPLLACEHGPTAPPDMEVGTFEAQARGLSEGNLTGDASISPNWTYVIDGSEYPGENLIFNGLDPETGLAYQLTYRKIAAEVYGRFHLSATGYLPRPWNQEHGDLWLEGSFRAVFDG